LAISVHLPADIWLDSADFLGIRGGTILAFTLAMMTHTDTRQALPTRPPLRKVMVVGNQPHQRVLETVADAGSYDVIIVESTARAYSHIKRVVPTLVILCLDLDDPEGCHVLSMLKLDSATSEIPVLTMAGEADDEEMGGEEVALVMN
jgi:PleD family two-component response regulator